MSAKRKHLVSAKRITIYIHHEAQSMPCITQFDYFFLTPVNQIEVQKFLSPLVKQIRLSISGWRFGPTRMVSPNRIWSKRKIEEDILNS